MKIILKEKKAQPYTPATFDPKNVQAAQGTNNTPRIQLRTYADLKKALDAIAAGQNFEFVKDTGKIITKDALLGLVASGTAKALGVAAAGTGVLAIGAGVVGTVAVLQKFLNKKDSVKTDTFLDKLDIDDRYSAMIANEAEVEFLKTIYEFISEKAKTNTPLPSNFNMNRELETWIKSKYQRDLKGAP